MTKHATSNAKRVRDFARSHCNQCSGVTAHKVLHSEVLEDEDEERFYSYEAFETQACGGCGALKFVVRSADDSDRSGEYDEAGHPLFFESERSFPPVPFRRRPSLGWNGIPQKIQRVLHEVYAACDSKLLTLAAMGVRTIIDTFADLNVGDVGTFDQKLDELLEKQFITKQDRQYLSVVVDAGNAAAHRGGIFSAEQVNHMLDTVEHLLQARYTFKEPSRALKKATPKRRRRRKPRAPVKQ